MVPCKRWYKHTNLRKLSVVLLRHTYPWCSWCLMFEIHHLNYCSVDTHANISALLLIRNVVLRRNRSRCFGAVLRAAVCTHVLYTALYSLKCISNPNFQTIQASNLALWNDRVFNCIWTTPPYQKHWFHAPGTSTLLGQPELMTRLWRSHNLKMFFFQHVRISPEIDWC